LDTRPLLKVASGGSSETLVPIYQTIRRYMPDEGSVYSHRWTNLQNAVPASTQLQRYNTSLSGRLFVAKRVKYSWLRNPQSQYSMQ